MKKRYSELEKRLIRERELRVVMEKLQLRKNIEVFNTFKLRFFGIMTIQSEASSENFYIESEEKFLVKNKEF